MAESGERSAPKTGAPTPEIPGYQILESGPLYSARNAFHAFQITTNRFVDLTVIRCPADIDRQRWAAAVTQYRSLLDAQMPLNSNPHIQRMLEFGETEALFYIVQEAVEGRTLRQILAAEGPRKGEWLLPYLTQVGNALDFAASYRLHHLALTPNRIVITPDGQRACILDFTVARLRRVDGSPYAAPEQLVRSGEGSHEVNHVDMYALGAILYECLSGRPAFTGASEVELARNILNTLPWPLLDQPLYVREIVARMMTRIPEQRYQTFIDAIHDLQLQRRPPVYRAPEPIEPLEGLVGNLKPDEVVEDPDRVIDNPTTVHAPGIILYTLQQAWKSIRAALALLPAARKKVAGLVRKAGSAPDTEEEDTSPSRIWEFVTSQIPLTLLYGRRPTRPTENPAVYNKNRRYWKYARLARKALRRTLKTAVVLALLLIAHAVLLLSQRSYAVVTHLSGHASYHLPPVNGRPPHEIELHQGDRLDIALRPTVTTEPGKGVQLTLEMPDVRLKLDSDTQIHLRPAEQQLGLEHRYDLLHGKLWAELDPTQGTGDRLMVHTEAADVTGMQRTAFVVAILQDLKDLKKRLSLAMAERGNLTVSNGFTTEHVPQDGKLEAYARHRLHHADAMSTAERRALERQFGDLEGNTAFVGQILKAYQDLQQNTVEPPVEQGLTLAHLLPDPASQQKLLDKLTPQWTMQQIYTLLVADPPENLNLITLEEILPDDPEGQEKYLDYFEGHRLLYYQSSGDSFTLYARGIDQVLYKATARNAVEKIAGNKEQQELANLLPD